jgi:hypothetical protein
VIDPDREMFLILSLYIGKCSYSNVSMEGNVPISVQSLFTKKESTGSVSSVMQSLVAIVV